MSKTQKVKLGTPAERADHRANVAIKKSLPGGRAFFFGRERNKRSRKYRHKLFTKQPIDLMPPAQHIDLTPPTEAKSE